jgi:hypothetical protein
MGWVTLLQAQGEEAISLGKFWLLVNSEGKMVSGFGSFLTEHWIFPSTMIGWVEEVTNNQMLLLG